MRRDPRLVLWLLAMGGAAPPAAADIVVLVTGDFLRVDAYDVGKDSVRLELPFGGTMVLPLGRVERILDDELSTEQAEPGPLALPGVEIGFSEDQPLPETQYAEMFYEVGRRYSLNPRLLASIASAESGFEPWARSNKGALGIMQVMPATAERFGVDPDQLYDPLVCMDVGARYLAFLRQRYEGDLTLMLAAYNAGEATVERYGGVPPYAETQTYIRRIYRNYTEGPG
jgi:hypothetical protein